MKLKSIIVIAFLFSFPIFLVAQNYKATTKLDSTSILIGDYLNVHLEVTSPKGEPIRLPKINSDYFQSTGSLIEWVENSKIDTLFSGNQQILKQTFTVSVFDSGSYYFPALQVLSLDSLILAQTDSLFFSVNTIPVDTTAAYKDIKGNLATPLTLHEIWLYLKKYGLLILLIAVLIALIIYIIVKYSLKDRKSGLSGKDKKKPKDAAHVIALKALDRLKKKKLWEQGHVKEYYSELTEIVRGYLENRWNIYAMEMVSSEIITEIEKTDIDKNIIDILQKMLHTADLVKFAKWNPMPDDHDMAFKNAYTFVEKSADYNETSIPNS
jgi:hypothetical protein